MGFIVIVPLAALAGWSIFAIARWLRRGAFGAKWWRAFVALTAVGLALGAWFAFAFQYDIANVHLEGFPIPIKISPRKKPVLQKGLATNSASPNAEPVAPGVTSQENPTTNSALPGEKSNEFWVGSDMPVSILVGGRIANVLSGVALCLVPIAVAAFFKENSGKGPFANPNSP